MKIDVDLDELHAFTAAAARSLREEQPAEMKRILDAACAEDAAGHAYLNRTGDAEAATAASEIMQIGDDVIVQAGMDVPYASYLDRRGFTEIVPLLEGAATELEYYFDGATFE